MPIIVSAPAMQCVTSLGKRTNLSGFQRSDRLDIFSYPDFLVSYASHVSVLATFHMYRQSPFHLPLFCRIVLLPMDVPPLKVVRQGPYEIQIFEPASYSAKHLRSPMVRVLNITSLALHFLYHIVNFYTAFTLPPIRGKSKPFWRFWIMIFAEFWLSMIDLMARSAHFSPIISRKQLWDRPRYRLIGNTAPSIDVCILACGEDVEVIMDTVVAALTQHYPSEHYKVFLLDDGNSTELQNAASHFNARRKQSDKKEVFYLSRKAIPGVRTHFKAGNLNFGLQETQRASGATYFASLDADMIVKSDWLRAVVPHLILDDQVALANPPQVSVRALFRTP